MIVVALSGYKRAGKDSVADILVRDHGFTKMSFAAPVKRLLRTLDPVVGSEQYLCDCGNMEDCPPVVDLIRISDLDAYGYDDESIKESPWAEEVRDLWQRFATEVIRAEDPDFWVRLAEKDLLESGSDRVVFTDCRFPNEAEMIYGLNGPFFADGELSFSPIRASVWEISRPGVEAGEHESEQHAGLLEEEIQIINDGSLEMLPAVVAEALAHTTDEHPKHLAERTRDSIAQDAIDGTCENFEFWSRKGRHRTADLPEGAIAGQGLLWAQNVIGAGDE